MNARAECVTLGWVGGGETLNALSAHACGIVKLKRYDCCGNEYDCCEQGTEKNVANLQHSRPPTPPPPAATLALLSHVFLSRASLKRRAQLAVSTGSRARSVVLLISCRSWRQQRVVVVYSLHRQLPGGGTPLTLALCVCVCVCFTDQADQHASLSCLEMACAAGTLMPSACRTHDLRASLGAIDAGFVKRRGVPPGRSRRRARMRGAVGRGRPGSGASAPRAPSHARRDRG